MHENKRNLRTRLPGKTQYAKQCFLATTTELKSNEKTRQNTYKLLFSSAVRLLLLDYIKEGPVLLLLFPLLLSLPFDWTFKIWSMCLLFSFVGFEWMLCCDVVCEKKKC